MGSDEPSAKRTRMDAPSAGRSNDLLAAGLLVALVVALVAPAIVGAELGRKAYDHCFFHLPLVRAWAASWPWVPLDDYNSATGPFYHWVMAGVGRLIGTDGLHFSSLRLQFASAGFGAAVVLIAFRHLRRFLDTTTAFVAAAALACSPYLLGNAIWLMTDNLSLALVAAVVGSAAFSGPRQGGVIGQGILSGLAVATRQINIWLLGPMGIAWLLREPARGRSVSTLVLGAAIPLMVLGSLVWLWGGLVPPRFQGLHASGLNPAAIGFTLTLAATYGVCMLLAVPDGLRRIAAKPLVLLALVLVGAGLAAIGPSFASLEAGRNGGWLWRSVEALPVVAGRSTLIVVGGAAGVVVLAALQSQARRAGHAAEGLVVLTALASFVAAHVANAQVFQRYYDPMVILCLLWLTALGVPPLERVPQRLRWGFTALLAQQACFSAAVIGFQVG